LFVPSSFLPSFPSSSLFLFVFFFGLLLQYDVYLNFYTQQHVRLIILTFEFLSDWSWWFRHFFRKNICCSKVFGRITQINVFPGYPVDILLDGYKFAIVPSFSSW
jgi:hypothetical protein